MISAGPLSDVQLHYVDDVDTASECMRWLGERRRDGISFDSESGGFSFKKDALRLCQFGDENHGWAIPWDRWGGVAQEVFARYDGKLILHNRPFDANFALEKGVVRQFPWERSHCTMIMAHVLNPVRSKALKSLTAELVDKTAAAGQEALKRFMSANGFGWHDVPLDNPYYWGYGAMDTVLTTRLYHVLSQQLHDEGVADVYDMELAVQRICANMTRRGTPVDLAYSVQTADLLRAWVKEARAWAKSEFGVKNVTSAMQTIKVFEEDGIEFTELTATGQVRLDKNVLLTLDHPLAACILKIRKAEKLCSTYLDNFHRLADDEGRIHPTIWTLGARTTRMSCSDPNLQNLPKDDTTIRNAVIPIEHHRLVTTDADQIEMRLTAHFGHDQGLMDAFAETAAAAAAGETDPVKIDFFCRVATELYGRLIDKKNPLRKITKNTTYANIYGAGPAKIALTAGVDRSVIDDVIGRMNESFPGLGRLMRDTEVEVRRNLAETGRAFVTTIDGRRLPVDKDKIYAGTNYKIQSAAAIIFKRALIALDASDYGDHLLVPVHDEIVAMVHESDAEQAARDIPRIMEASSEGMFDLPLTWGADLLPGAWGGRSLSGDDERVAA